MDWNSLYTNCWVDFSKNHKYPRRKGAEVFDSGGLCERILFQQDGTAMLNARIVPGYPGSPDGNLNISFPSQKKASIISNFDASCSPKGPKNHVNVKYGQNYSARDIGLTVTGRFVSRTAITAICPRGQRRASFCVAINAWNILVTNLDNCLSRCITILWPSLLFNLIQTASALDR